MQNQLFLRDKKGFYVRIPVYKNPTALDNEASYQKKEN